MGTLNLGILAHVDAGKTSLTERILFETGVIGSVGSVDKGTTQTDTMELERALGDAIDAGDVSPVYAGSAITGAGARGLLDGIERWLMPPAADDEAPLSGLGRR